MDLKKSCMTFMLFLSHTYLYILSGTQEKQDEFSMSFLKRGGFLKSNSPRFPAKRGVKLMENSMERGVKSFQTD